MATGAAIAGAVVGAGGLVQGKRQGDKADAQFDSAQASQQAQFDFNQGQLDDWEAQFGSIDQNLNDYYSNLDPNKYAMEGKQNLRESTDKQMKQFNESMSAQGLQSSGMRVQAEKEAAFGLAQGNAAIDMAAPEQVNQMQQSYLQSNEHRRTNAIGGINSAFGNQQDLHSQQADQYGKSQSGWMGMAGSAIGAGIGYGADAFGGGSRYSSQTPIRGLDYKTKVGDY